MPPQAGTRDFTTKGASGRLGLRHVALNSSWSTPAWSQRRVVMGGVAPIRCAAKAEEFLAVSVLTECREQAARSPSRR